MDYVEKESLVNRIITGVTIVKYGDTFYFVSDPSPLDLIKVEPYYNEVYDNLISRNVPSEDDLKAILLDKGIWSSDKDRELITLKDNLKKLKDQLPNLEYKSVEKRQVISYIEKTNSEIKKINLLKSYLLNQSAEYLAKIEKYKKLIFLLTKDECGDRIWANWKGFVTSDDKLINHLLSESYFSNDIDEKRLRLIARSDPWRTIWIGGQKTGNLFEKPMSQMTELQRALVSWSILYDNVFEHPEAPPRDVIDNDILLDHWLEQQMDKKSVKNDSSNIPGNPKITNSQEVGIVVDNEEDANKVYNLNNSGAKRVLNTREKLLQEKGHVKNTDMPDVRQRLMMEINQANIQGIKNR